MPHTQPDSIPWLFAKNIVYGEQQGLVRTPDLRQAKSIVLASDYSGEHQTSDYQLLTFLIGDIDQVLGNWDKARTEVRTRCKLGSRRHAYKSLTDQLRKQALVPFLRAAEQLNGMILSVAMDKRLGSSNLGFQFDATLKPQVLGKLTRVSLFSAILVAGLASQGQSLMWITDDDEIVSNEKVQSDLGMLFGTLLKSICPVELSSVQIGIAGKFEDDCRAEDLCAIPDLVGGAMCEYLNAYQRAEIPTTGNLHVPFTKNVSTKAEIINSWYASLSGSLSGVFCLVRPHQRGFQLSFANPELGGAGNSERLWLPLSPDWRRASRTW